MPSTVPKTKRIKPVRAWASVIADELLCLYAQPKQSQCKDILPDDPAIRVWIVPADGSYKITPTKGTRRAKR